MPYRGRRFWTRGTCWVFLFATCLSWGQERAASPREELEQAVTELQRNSFNRELREKVIKLASSLKPPPTIPEEARRSFIKASTTLKEATASDDYDRAIYQYNDALRRAPWWPEAYFNLAKALELRQRYSQAIEQLKLYLLTSPTNEDARLAQDRIYAIEAKETIADEAFLRLIKSLPGKWRENRESEGYIDIYEIDVTSLYVSIRLVGHRARGATGYSSLSQGESVRYQFMRLERQLELGSRTESFVQPHLGCILTVRHAVTGAIAEDGSRIVLQPREGFRPDLERVENRGGSSCDHSSVGSRFNIRQVQLERDK